MCHRLLGLPVEAKAELRDEPGAPEKAQWILSEPVSGISNRSHESMGDVGLTFPGVDDLARRRVNGDGVHSEVTSVEIVFQGRVKGDGWEAS
jgi:hypothetical protein